MATFQAEWGKSGGERHCDSGSAAARNSRLQVAEFGRFVTVAVSASARTRLFHRLLFVRSSGYRTDRIARHSARRRVSARGAGIGRAVAGPDCPVSEFERRRNSRRLDPRGLGRAVRALSALGGVAARVALLVCLVLWLSISHRRTGFSLVSVGHPAAGSRLPRALRRRIARPRLALPLAALPADVLQRRRQTAERRSRVAQPDRA